MEEKKSIKVGEIYVRKEYVYLVLEVERTSCVLFSMNAPTYKRICFEGHHRVPADMWFGAGFRLM